MKQFVRALLMLAVWSASVPVMAEEVWYPGGKRLILPLADKIQRSMSGAAFVAEGMFVELQPERPLEVLDERRGLREVGFQVTRRLDQGKALAGPLVTLKLVAYRPLAGAANAPADSAALAMSREVERAAGGNLVVYKQYLDAMNGATAALLSARGYMKDFFVLPVAVGGLDAPYRVADVVVQFGKKYVIFVMRDIAGAAAAPLYPSDVDIYNADEPAVLATVRPGG
ncbi:hypothetical protein [Massilia sp. Root418]|uniref:hypothetical protein n=1 Tax=Massilia sp. Root418 TaxID=1736532 RepID=UPI000A645D7D|nr:hypothetical protein [Massilia sp. Root418]